MGSTPRIWIAGIIAYGTSQTLNVTIFSHAASARGGKLLWLRAGVASVLSQIVDTLLFITIAFYGVFPIGELLLGQMLAKVVLSVVMVPPLIYVFVALGRRLDARPVKRASSSPACSRSPRRPPPRSRPRRPAADRRHLGRPILRRSVRRNIASISPAA